MDDERSVEKNRPRYRTEEERRNLEEQGFNPEPERRKTRRNPFERVWTPEEREEKLGGKR